MNILIPDSWLREFLKTKATPSQIAEYLSLSGPSVEKTTKSDNDWLYDIEVTTNRVDTASVVGIAREAGAILPQFGIKTKFLGQKKYSNIKFVQKTRYLSPAIDHKLCSRFTAILIKNIKIFPSPDWMQRRLVQVGIRPINNVVDISNYIMHELGQPTHTFDYDKIRGAKMVLREGKPGEEIITLDGKVHKLQGGDIVIEDGEKRLIDLAGIMGGELSAVDEDTKNVLLFVQTYNPLNIRKTSMSLNHRTEAAVLFEKGIDPELVSDGILRGIHLFKELTGGTAEKEVLDIYPAPYNPKKIKTDLIFINDRLGISLSRAEISKTLGSLGFAPKWKSNNLSVSVPSFRSLDISIPEDIIEEVARIYGYHNLSSELMAGNLPEHIIDSGFDFEMRCKMALKGFGAVEIYTSSLVPKDYVSGRALKLRNPLGLDSEYLRTSLMPSLVAAAKENLDSASPFHLFEMANVYLPKGGDLPDEKTVLAGIFCKFPFRKAKGVVEALLEELHVVYKFETQEEKFFLPERRLVVRAGGTEIGVLGNLENNLTYYEFPVTILKRSARSTAKYQPIPKYPAQIEDITFILPERTRVGNFISWLKNVDNLIAKTELTGIFQDAYTFRIWYQHASKTLTDSDVKEVRTEIVEQAAKKYGARLKN